MGSFYRSMHELIFAFKKGSAPYINSFELGPHGRYLDRLGIAGGPDSREEGSTMSKTTNKFASEVRERAVRSVLD